VRYRHPEHGFAIDLPDDFEIYRRPPLVALLAYAPEDVREPFKAAIGVGVEDAKGADVERFTDASLVEQERDAGFQLIDRVSPGFSSGGGTRTLGHHELAGRAATVEQWRLVVGEVGYTITTTCWTLVYETLVHAFAAAAETFRPAEGPP